LFSEALSLCSSFNVRDPSFTSIWYNWQNYNEFPILLIIKLCLDRKVLGKPSNNRIHKVNPPFFYSSTGTCLWACLLQRLHPRMDISTTNMPCWPASYHFCTAEASTSNIKELIIKVSLCFQYVKKICSTKPDHTKSYRVLRAQ
jgi:hypothetical protein